MIYPYLILYLATLFFSPDPISTQEQQYYRGIYDICVYQGLKHQHEPGFVRIACRTYVRELTKNEWYQKNSPGWVWPLPASGESGG